MDQYLCIDLTQLVADTLNDILRNQVMPTLYSWMEKQMQLFQMMRNHLEVSIHQKSAGFNLIEIINQYSICENECSFSTLLAWKRTSTSPFFVAQILSTDFSYCCLSFLPSRLHHQFSSNCIERVRGNN